MGNFFKDAGKLVGDFWQGAGDYLTVDTDWQRAVGDVVANVVTFGYTGQRKALKEQRRAMDAQRVAQAQSLAATQNQARLAKQAEARVNQRRSSWASLLARAVSASLGGVESTSLTGVGGVPKKNLRLGETSLLGE